MMALLFALFFTSGILAIKGRSKQSLTLAYLSLLVTAAWFLHHAQDELAILL